MGLNSKVEKVNELLADELALSGLDRTDNSNIIFSNRRDDGLHINDRGIRQCSGNIRSLIKYC